MNENLSDFSRNETLWWQKMGKVVNQVKLAIMSQSEPHFGGKDGKTCKPKLVILSQYKPPLWQNLPL